MFLMLAIAMVSARPHATFQYNPAPVQYNPAPLQFGYRYSLDSVLVPGHIFKTIAVPVYYQISVSYAPPTSLVPAPAPEPNLPAIEPEPSPPSPIAEPEPILPLPAPPTPSPPLSSSTEASPPAPTPIPTPSVRIPVSTRRPHGGVYHREADSESSNSDNGEIPSETVEPPSTEATTPSNEKNPNNVTHANNIRPSNPPSLIHHSGN